MCRTQDEKYTITVCVLHCCMPNMISRKILGLFYETRPLAERDQGTETCTGVHRIRTHIGYGTYIVDTYT